MTVDYTQLLSRTPADAPKPQALPVGDYPGVIKSWKLGEKSRNQQKDTIVSFLCGFLDWPDGAEPEASIKLPNVQMSLDIYVTDEGGRDQTWRIFALAESCGIAAEGRPLSEVLPELIGQPVLLAISHYTNKNSGETQAQIAKIVGDPV